MQRFFVSLFFIFKYTYKQNYEILSHTHTCTFSHTQTHTHSLSHTQAHIHTQYPMFLVSKCSCICMNELFSRYTRTWRLFSPLPLLFSSLICLCSSQHTHTYIHTQKEKSHTVSHTVKNIFSLSPQNGCMLFQSGENGSFLYLSFIFHFIYFVVEQICTCEIFSELEQTFCHFAALSSFQLHRQSFNVCTRNQLQMSASYPLRWCKYKWEHVAQF